MTGVALNTFPNLLLLFIIIAFIIIALFKVGEQTLLNANKNQLMKFTKCSSNVKREVTHKLIHPESIFKMLQIAGILTDHIATSQLNTISAW